ncbi:MAG: rhomboid family intramembrane serine protease [Planctomycetales bacterium]|nr:rhomboid family intramembrane serine protease [Planctomycetales bacterium]
MEKLPAPAYVYVTPVLIGINAVVFVLMVVFGVSPTSPTTADLLRWGADYGPMTLLDGEWWRLLTSMFIHIGIIHIGMNMWVLYAAGPLVERMVGNVGFLLMYIVAGLCGGLASLCWNPVIVSAGASGAIFGIYGCLFGLVARGHGSIPTQVLVQLRSSAGGFLVYNLIFGMMIPNLDMAAHLGGLAGGFLCGLVLSQHFTPAAWSGRLWRNLMLTIFGACLITGGMFGVASWQSGPVKVQRELDQFAEVEKDAFESFNSASKKAQRNEISDSEFADQVERDVLPKWRNAKERLTALKPVPPKYQRRVDKLLEYMRLRQEAWEFFAQGRREGNPQKIQDGFKKQRLADEAANDVFD